MSWSQFIILLAWGPRLRRWRGSRGPLDLIGGEPHNLEDPTSRPCRSVGECHWAANRRALRGIQMVPIGWRGHRWALLRANQSTIMLGGWVSCAGRGNPGVQRLSANDKATVEADGGCFRAWNPKSSWIAAHENEERRYKFHRCLLCRQV